jgi:hypothetical protein
MGGYGDLQISEGVNEPLAARCTIIWDAGNPNVIVTADVLGFGRGLHQQIRAEIVAMGVPTADFVLTATHTHKGPALLEVLDPYMAYGITDQSALHNYTSDLAATIVNLVDETLSAPRTYCTLDYHVLSANFSFNRVQLPYVERDVPVLVARDLDGGPGRFCSVTERTLLPVECLGRIISLLNILILTTPAKRSRPLRR